VVPLSGIFADTEGIGNRWRRNHVDRSRGCSGPVPPSVEGYVSPVVLFCVPATVPVTFTAKVTRGCWPPELRPRQADHRLVACVAVIVPPPQLPVRPFGVETRQARRQRVILKPHAGQSRRTVVVLNS